MSRQEPKKKLVGQWRNLHGAIWLIGLALLIWKGWMWPGILFLIAFSAILEFVIVRLVPSSYVEEEVEPSASSQNSAPSVFSPPFTATAGESITYHPEQLPTNCSRCGAPARGHEVKWTSPYSADCSFCGANLPLSKPSP
jgi:hypothetical protein